MILLDHRFGSFMATRAVTSWEMIHSLIDVSSDDEREETDNQYDNQDLNP